MMRNNFHHCLKATVLIIALSAGYSCSDQNKVTVRELKDHIKYLSSDLLEGRLTGSKGDSLAAEYIMNEFRSCGLVPLSGDGFQHFTVTGRLVTGTNNSLNINGKDYFPRKDFMPFAFSSGS
ncbi:MAG: hypothetical protein GX876_11420, partial [Bacteroidales bacterium]|nr:hypothetical protein [Bacteroidales bacterium]